MAAMIEMVQVQLSSKQGKCIVKVTFNNCPISKTKKQTKVMLLLIPEGFKGPFYGQSAMRIWTVLVYTGKDGKEQLQVNLEKVLEKIQDVLARCMHHCAK
jgi:hypothetical protein